LFFFYEGYGDTYPITFLGKFVGGTCSIVGIIFLGLPVYFLVTNFLMLRETMNSIESVAEQKHDVDNLKGKN